MRFARSALAAAGLAVAMLNVTGPALADTKPSPVPATRSSSAPAEAPAETPVPAPATRSGSEPAAAPAEAPAQADPTRAEPRPVPEGAPETGGGPVGGALVPAGLVPVGGVLLLAGAGTGLLTLRRRKHARV